MSPDARDSMRSLLRQWRTPGFRPRPPTLRAAWYCLGGTGEGWQATGEDWEAVVAAVMPGTRLNRLFAVACARLATPLLGPGAMAVLDGVEAGVQFHGTSLRPGFGDESLAAPGLATVAAPGLASAPGAEAEAAAGRLALALVILGGFNHASGAAAVARHALALIDLADRSGASWRIARAGGGFPRPRCTAFGDMGEFLVGMLDASWDFDPAWRTHDCVALARGIDAERAWDRLPVLADALEDAGCGDADVLAHLRGPGPFCRGLRVVDELLGLRPGAA